MAHSFTGCRAASHTGRACNKNSTRVTRRDPRERGLLLARDEPDARRAGEARARPERAAGREVAAQRGEHRLALRGRQLAQPLGRADPDWELAAEREKRGWERRGGEGTGRESPRSTRERARDEVRRGEVRHAARPPTGLQATFRTRRVARGVRTTPQHTSCAARSQRLSLLTRRSARRLRPTLNAIE